MGEHFEKKIDHNFRFSWRSSSQLRGISSYGYIGLHMQKIARHFLIVSRETDNRQKNLLQIWFCGVSTNLVDIAELGKSWIKFSEKMREEDEEGRRKKILFTS